MRRAVAVAALTLAAPMLATGAGAGGQTIAHTLRYASAEDVATLNPDLNQQSGVAYLSQMTAAYLFRLDAQNRPIPELATVVPSVANGGISKDGRTVTLHLRHGVRWSDGMPFGADDVAFSIAAMNNPKNSVPSRHGFDQIDRVVASDSTTVIVHLKAPYGAIVSVLFESGTQFAILPKHSLGGLRSIDNAPFNALPIGIGPFRYAAWRRGDAVVLERNPYYWGGRAALDRVVMKLIPDRNTILTQLQTHELDLYFPVEAAQVDRIRTLSGYHLLLMPGYGVDELLLNASAPVTGDPAVRRALRFAVDRRYIRDKLDHGLGVIQNAVMPTIDPAAPRDIPVTSFSFARANATLDAAGWVRGPDGVRTKDGRRLSLAFVSTTGTPGADMLIELIRSWWTPLGIEIGVRRYSAVTLFASGGILESGKFDLVFLGEDQPSPFDITGQFGCAAFPPTGQNVGRYCNRRVDALAAEYDRSTEESQRARLLSRALHVIDDDAAAIVMSESENAFGISDAVKNFAPNNATPFDDMIRVDVVP